MRRDQVSTSRDLNLSSVEGFLLTELYEYAQSSRFANDLTEAYRFYWGGSFDVAARSRIEPQDIRRMFEWFIHDYHTSTDRAYIIDLFQAIGEDRFTEEVQDLAESWARSTIGLFRVLDMREDYGLELHDCLRGEEILVRDRTAARNGRSGDLLLGRLYELDGNNYLSPMTLILPGEYETVLVAYVSNAFELYRDVHPESTWDEFLRENGHILNAALLSPGAGSFRHLVGPGTRFHDPATARDLLRDTTAELAREADREQAASERRQVPLHRTTSGIILPGAPPSEPAAEGEKAPSRSKILIPGRDT